MNNINFQKICNDLCDTYSLEPIKVELKNTRRGYARHKKRKITIPKFAVGYGKPYSLYYIIHEFCHFLTNGGHCSYFKDVETEVLESYGLIPIYKRVFAKELYDLNDNLLWPWEGQK